MVSPVPVASTSASVPSVTSSSPGSAALDSPGNSNRPPNRKASNSPDPQSLQYAVTSGVAGGLAACIAKTSVAPLDRVKILFQTQSPDYQRYAGTWLGVFRAGRDIYAETGIRGLLQGHSATLLRIFPYGGIKYASYDKIHFTLMPTPDKESSARRFCAGSLAGVTSALITYPLELIRVRLAFETPHTPDQRSSFLKTVRQIYREPPLPLPSRANTSSAPTPPPPIVPSKAPTPPSLTHFYRGVGPTIFGIIPYAGTSFLIWGFLKRELEPKYLSTTFRSSHRSALDLVEGGLSGALGQTAAYPLDIIRRRMQVGPAITPGKRSGWIETANQVYKTGGWRSFFVGLSIGYLKVVPMNAVSFASWEALKVAFGLDAAKVT